MEHGAGLIGVISWEVGRYRAFDIALQAVERPDNTSIVYSTGLMFDYNTNRIIKLALENNYEWVWLLDDDHVFEPDILMNLLNRNVDFVFPMCLQRMPPFNPVLHKSLEEGGNCSGFENLKGKSGIVDIGNWSTGKGCVLIRRSVFEKISYPWFENGILTSQSTASDTYFCKKMNDAGVPVYVDLDNVTGHITPMAIWPEHDAEYNWGYSIRTSYN